MRRSFSFLTLLAVTGLAFAASTPDSFRFVLLGDRTGETQPGVFEQVLQEAAAEHPAFILSVGDLIQGLNDATAEKEWQALVQILAPYRRYPLQVAPGNHDIWSERSERLFRKYTGHAPHYSFDYGKAHFTILDNSRSQQFSPDDLTFLEKDLQAHTAQPVKFIVSHQPSWIVDAILRNPSFPVHQIAKKYGVRYIIAGHVHQMLHVDFDGVTYVSMASSGGHLRASKRYEDGWFFGYMLVEVSGIEAGFRIKELKAPHGEGRTTGLEDWSTDGLISKNKAAAATR
jgi:Icc protein